MSPDSPLVSDSSLADTVRALIAEVLMVPLDRVLADAPLIAELGAESVDFLDLVFRIEDALGTPIPLNHWQQFVRQRLGDANLSYAITPRIVLEFAESEAK